MTPRTTQKPSQLANPQTEDHRPPEAEAAAQPNPLAWLTVETALYAVILLAGLALRLADLGAYPLAAGEARQGLLGLQLYQAEPVTAESYSPLLVTLNSLIFLLFHQSDAAARLAATLLGSALLLLPLTLRQWLGRRACLLTTLLLALSPTAIFLSRTLNSQIAVALGALAIVSGFFNWAESGQQRWLYLLAGGVALLLTAGPLAYTIVLMFGLIILLRLADFKRLGRQGLALAEAASPAEAAPSNSKKAAAEEDEEEEEAEVGLSLPAPLQGPLIFLAAALFLLSTAVTFNLSGFGVTTNLFVEWLSRFSFEPQLDGGFNAVFLLTIYEPLLVAAGLVGVAYVILQPTPLRLTLVIWFGGSLLIDLVMAGRPSGAVILPLIPLAFLAGLALAQLWRGLEQKGSWSNEGLILLSGLVIAGFGYIGLTGWLVRFCPSGDTFCEYAWLQAVAALALFFVVVAFFGYIQGPNPALRGLALTGVTLGFIATLSFGWRLNYGPLMNLAYQPLAGAPASAELPALAETLAQESIRRAGDKTLLDVTVVGQLHPSLQWLLRDYPNVRQVNSFIEAPTAPALITPIPQEETLSLGEAYLGQDFAVDALWSPVGLAPKDLINWLVYREVNQQPQSNQVVLWLRVD